MSSIEWTDTTWNPVVGCTPVSPGCLNCYAATMARRLEAMGRPEYAPRVEPERQTMPDAFGVRTIPAKTVRIAEVRSGRAVFTGEVRTLQDRLVDPLKWQTPRRVFVNSMSDLFHESVPFEFIDRVFAVMALCPRHTFQVLTKRPERMAEYMSTRWRKDGDGGSHAHAVWNAKVAMQGKPVSPMEWPLPNVWLGTSVEDQSRADERIPHLVKCPAAVRFLSCEPLLGPLDLSAYFGGKYVGLPGDVVHNNYNFGVDWAIVGGESGPKSRPCDVEWVRSIVRQCTDAGVACFVKQLGRNIVIKNDSCSEWPNEGDGLVFFQEDDRMPVYQGDPMMVRTVNAKGGDPSEWPADLRVREFPAVGGVVNGGGA